VFGKKNGERERERERRDRITGPISKRRKEVGVE
jgi:hypothetical protein